ncbi:MAG: hypothetical protein AAFW81_10900 [Pseudomonadota bacterium]
MLLFFGIVILALAGMHLAFWRWRRKIEQELGEGAAIEWAHFQKNEPAFIEGLDEAAFTAIYKRVNDSRFPGYALATLTTFLLALPVIFALLVGAQWFAGAAGIIPEPIEVARQMSLEGDTITILGNNLDEETRYQTALYYIRDLAGFYYFFGVLICWLIIVAFFMRRYHARRPGYLRDEIIRAR